MHLLKSSSYVKKKTSEFSAKFINILTLVFACLPARVSTKSLTSFVGTPFVNLSLIANIWHIREKKGKGNTDVENSDFVALEGSLHDKILNS